MKTSHINPAGRRTFLMPISVSKGDDIYDLTEMPDDSTTVSQHAFALKSWVKNRAPAKIAAARAAFGYEYDIYDDILSLLWDSPTARILLKFAAEHQWSIEVEPLEDAAYDLDPDQKTLLINNYHLKFQVFEKAGYFRHAFILSLVKGLRDIWHTQSRQPYESGLSLETMVLLERVRAADCDVIALLCAWELRGNGAPEIWRHLIGTAEGDMAICYIKTLDSHPEKLFSGAALVEAFYMWFKNDSRVASCDHHTLEMIDETLGESDDLGAALYGTKSVTHSFIESLSQITGQSLYLKGCGQDIINNPECIDLKDDVNHIHFLQIQRELSSTRVGGVSFRSADLAAKIFPAGSI